MKKRWYLLMIAAGLLLCAVSIRFFQRLPKPVFALVAAGGSLGSLLCRAFRYKIRYSFRLTRNSTTSGTP